MTQETPEVEVNFLLRFLVFYPFGFFNFVHFHGGPPWADNIFSCSSMLFSAPATESGVSEMESMPHRTRKAAKSGWSLGACPQMPIFLSQALARRITSAMDFLTASSCSSNSLDRTPESRSTPSVNWVKSLLPMENPSKR